jgi:GT2 family glycosyltransferase
MTIAAIVPAYNRKNVTLACLRRLREAHTLETTHVLVVDDASTDGTADAVAAEFPEVRVLKGTGSLYWTGAIELGMRKAVEGGADVCVWLNDDVLIEDRAIEKISALAVERQAVVTALGMIVTGVVDTWYHPGLYKGFGKLIERQLDLNNPEPALVDTCRGNVVAIPVAVIERIGYPDGRRIPHIGGDTDYTMRAVRAGFPCLVHKEARFREREYVKEENRSWLLERRPLRKIWREALSKRGNLYPPMVWTYFTRHWGVGGIACVIMAYGKLLLISVARLLVPRPVLLKLCASRSHAYKSYEWTRQNAARQETS